MRSFFGTKYNINRCFVAGIALKKVEAKNAIEDGKGESPKPCYPHILNLNVPRPRNVGRGHDSGAESRRGVLGL